MPSLPPESETPGLDPLLNNRRKRSKFLGGGNYNILRMFKLIPMLSTGCKMVALLNRPKLNPMLSDRATTVTLFGPRRGRTCLAIQEDPRSPPLFLIELPILTSTLHKEMSSGQIKIALESETRTPKKKLLDEYVWLVYCNGRKSGFAVRRKSTSEDEREVMRVLRGVSMGAGVLPDHHRAGAGAGAGEEVGSTDQLTYIRARFERAVGSKDSETLYMINPDGTSGGPDFSIFLVRAKG